MNSQRPIHNVKKKKTIIDDFTCRFKLTQRYWFVLKKQSSKKCFAERELSQDCKGRI